MSGLCRLVTACRVKVSVMDTDTLPRWMTQKAAAAYISADVRTVRRYVAAGKIRRHTLGGLTRYDRHEIDALMEQSAREQGEGA